MKTMLALLLLSFSSLFATEKLVILGGGPAGLTAAIYSGQADLSPLVITGSEDEGQLTVVNCMENYPGFPEGISGKDLAANIKIQAAKFGARFQSGSVASVDFRESPFRLTLTNGETIYSEAVIVAMGTSKKWLGLPSEEFFKGKGVYASATRDGHRFQGKNVVVLGAGDSAMEEALTLAEYATVTLIHNGDKFYASSYLQERVFSHDKIQVVFNKAVDEIFDVSEGFVTGVLLRDVQSGKKEIHSCDGIFVSIGREPNTSMFKGQLAMTEKGVLILSPHSSQTSIPGVFAAGDVGDPTYRKAITAAAGGCMAAIDAVTYFKNR